MNWVEGLSRSSTVCADNLHILLNLLFFFRSSLSRDRTTRAVPESPRQPYITSYHVLYSIEAFISVAPRGLAAMMLCRVIENLKYDI